MDEHLRLDLLTFAADLFLLFALAVPVCRYLTNGWRLRRREVLSSFIGEAVRLCFQTFIQAEYAAFEQRGKKQKERTWKLGKEIARLDASPEEERETEEEAALAEVRQEFERYHDQNSGRKGHVVPSVLLLAIASYLLLFFSPTIKAYMGKWTYWAPPGKSAPPEALCALASAAGAYMWVLKSLIGRVQERRLSPLDLLWGSFRLVLSIPVALAFSELFKGTLQGSALYAVAFMLGAFPTETLLTFMRRVAASKFGFQDSVAEPGADLTRLQGVTRNQAETFAHEGVDTILQLAYFDPVDLTIRTGFSFSYVVDCCSPALAWLCFETGMVKLRRYSLRGAQEIITLVYELNRQTEQPAEVMDEEQEWAVHALESVSLADADLDEVLGDLSGILIPGGFGTRGIEGKIRAVAYARQNKVPFFGICLGMQCALIEFARNVAGMEHANSSEFDEDTPYPVIDLLATQKTIASLGGTMRLGAYS